MKTNIIISALFAALVLAAPATALAQRGLGTIGGQAIGVDSSDAVKARTAGQRCVGTICGPPSQRTVKATKGTKRGFEASAVRQARSPFRSRCFATFCPMR